MPKVSVIVPVYKVEKYIDRCVESVIKQTFDDFELILVDDGSPDRCPQICDDYVNKDDRITVIHKENGGLSSARNAGIEAASAEYIFFLDSDDWIHHKTLEILYNLAKDNDAQIVSANYALVKGYEDIPDVKGYSTKVYEREDALEFYLKVGMSKRISEYPSWGKLYKRELFSGIRFPQGQLYEDVVTVFKLIKASERYVKVSMPLYYYFQCDASIVRSKFKTRDMDAVLVGEQLVEETRDMDAKLKKYSVQKKARGYFSVLCKIGFYGADESVSNIDEITADLYTEFKKGYKILMFSPMPLSRKIIATMLRINLGATLAVLNFISRRI